MSRIVLDLALATQLLCLSSQTLALMDQVVVPVGRVLAQDLEMMTRGPGLGMTTRPVDG